MKTAITEMFDIDIPLLAFSHCRDVVAAVSKAGGMGVLGAVAHTPKSLEIDRGLTGTGMFVGTPRYASPEQLRGETVDFRSDLYSVGATLYALLTAKPPFETDDGAAPLGEILSAPPMSIERRGPRVRRGSAGSRTGRWSRACSAGSI